MTAGGVVTTSGTTRWNLRCLRCPKTSSGEAPTWDAHGVPVAENRQRADFGLPQLGPAPHPNCRCQPTPTTPTGD